MIAPVQETVSVPPASGLVLVLAGIVKLASSVNSSAGYLSCAGLSLWSPGRVTTASSLPNVGRNGAPSRNSWRSSPSA